MTLEEEGQLFTRFSQATLRTHVCAFTKLPTKVCKREIWIADGAGHVRRLRAWSLHWQSLAEMHWNGCVGVRSQSGVGSTFAFFIGIRVVEDQVVETPTSHPLSQHQSSFEARAKIAHCTVLLVEYNVINVGLHEHRMRLTAFESKAKSPGATTSTSGVRCACRWTW